MLLTSTPIFMKNLVDRSQSLTGSVAIRDFQFNPLVTLVVALVRMNDARIHLEPAVESTANQ